MCCTIAAIFCEEKRKRTDRSCVTGRWIAAWSSSNCRSLFAFELEARNIYKNCLVTKPIRCWITFRESLLLWEMRGWRLILNSPVFPALPTLPHPSEKLFNLSRNISPRRRHTSTRTFLFTSPNPSWRSHKSHSVHNTFRRMAVSPAALFIVIPCFVILPSRESRRVSKLLFSRKGTALMATAPL